MDTHNPVLAAIRDRRSIRHFTGEEVGREELLAIIDAGRWAPSGLNNQPWRFLALKAGDPRQEPLSQTTKYARIVREAGALVAVLLEKSEMYNPVKDHQAAGAAMQNMLLAAHALGLGGVWLGEIINQEAEVLKVLGLPPDQFELMAVLALGRPARPGSSSRKDLNAILLEDI